MKAKLYSKSLENRRCYTMMDVLSGKDKDASALALSVHDAKQNLLVKAIINDPLFQAKMKERNLSNEATAAINELSNTAIEAAAPNAIGRDLVRLIETQKESVKIRLKALGKAKESDRGMKSKSKGQSNSYITITPDKEIEASEDWDLKFVEDSDWNILAEETEEVARACRDKETTLIVSDLEGISSGSLAGGATVDSATNGTLAWVDFTKMWGAVAAANWVPDKTALNPNQAADLFATEQFVNSLMLGNYVDLSRGVFGKTILGTDVLVSSKITDGKASMLDSTKVIQYVLRRDMMVTTWEETKDNNFGVKCSNRYGKDFGRKSALSRCDDC